MSVVLFPAYLLAKCESSMFSTFSSNQFGITIIIPIRSFIHFIQIITGKHYFAYCSYKSTTLNQATGYLSNTQCR